MMLQALRLPENNNPTDLMGAPLPSARSSEAEPPPPSSARSAEGPPPPSSTSSEEGPPSPASSGEGPPPSSPRSEEGPPPPSSASSEEPPPSSTSSGDVPPPSSTSSGDVPPPSADPLGKRIETSDTEAAMKTERGKVTATEINNKEANGPTATNSPLPIVRLSTSCTAQQKNFRPSEKFTSLMNIMQKNVSFPRGTSLVVFKLTTRQVQMISRFQQQQHTVSRETNPGWPRKVTFRPPRVVEIKEEGTAALEWDYRTDCLPQIKDICKRNKWRDMVLAEWETALNTKLAGGTKSCEQVEAMSVCTVRVLLFVIWIANATDIHNCNFNQSRVAFDRIYSWLVAGMAGGPTDGVDRSGVYDPPAVTANDDGQQEEEEEEGDEASTEPYHNTSDQGSSSGGEGEEEEAGAEEEERHNPLKKKRKRNKMYQRKHRQKKELREELLLAAECLRSATELLRELFRHEGEPQKRRKLQRKDAVAGRPEEES